MLPHSLRRFHLCIQFAWSLFSLFLAAVLLAVPAIAMRTIPHRLGLHARRNPADFIAIIVKLAAIPTI
jgi:hypothetical protein